MVTAHLYHFMYRKSSKLRSFFSGILNIFLYQATTGVNFVLQFHHERQNFKKEEKRQHSYKLFHMDAACFT